MKLTKELYTITETARLLSVSPDTIRLWIYNQKIPPEHVVKLPSGHRRITRSGLISLLQSKGIVVHKKTIIYARVSTNHQKESLKNQIDSLIGWANNNGISVDEVIYDIASGMNFTRPGLHKLIDMVERGEVGRIIIAYKDRLVRFGFEFFQWLFNKHGAELVIVNSIEDQPNSKSELIDDFVAIIHYFAMKLYGSRAYKRKTKQLEAIIKDEAS